MSVQTEFKRIADAIRHAFSTTSKMKASTFADNINKLAYINDNVTGKVDVVDVATPVMSSTDNKVIATVTQSPGYTSGGTKTAEIQIPSSIPSGCDEIGERTITPTTSNQTIPANTLITGVQTILGDTNLKSENILRGDYDQNLISIFGVKGTLDVVRKFNNYVGGSGYYGIQVADVARSYHLARRNGTCTFRYSQNKGLFSNGDITDEEGRCWLDCSGFVSLVLRGIDFAHSPFNTYKGQANKTFANTGLDRDIVAKLAEESEYVWANTYLDKQTHNKLQSLGRAGVYSIRRASQIAEYYYAQGCTIHEYTTSPTSVPTDLLPGDLLFWSKEGASDKQKSRFKAISHVGIVARDTTKFYETTGYTDERVSNTVFCNDIVDKLSELTLIIRPNYNPIQVPITPVGVNLLPQYCFDSLSVDTTKTSNGVTYKPSALGGFTVQRTSSGSIGSTFYIYESTNPVRLTPGTYKLSGTPKHATASSTGTSKVWGLSIKDVDTGEGLTNSSGGTVWDRGNGDTFTLTKTINAYVYFYVSKTLTDVSVYSVKPSLVMTSGVSINNDSSLNNSNVVSSKEEYTNCINEQGTINGKNYIYKLQKCKITAYGGDSGSACDIPLDLAKTCGTLNLPYGTKIYIPALDGETFTDGNGNSVKSDGVFTTNDCGVGCTDFDLYMSTKSDTDAEKVFGNTLREDVYVLSWGSGHGTAWSYTESYKWAYNQGTLSDFKPAFKDYIKYDGTLINFTKFKTNDKNIRSSNYWTILNN